MTSIESNVIRILRVSAMISIVICHFLQAYGLEFKYIFNIGVQAFFVLSGFLYGNKGTTDIKPFFKKRIEKIYFPYLVLFVLMIPLWYLAQKTYSWSTILVYALNLGGGRHLFDNLWIDGFQHTWFLTAIMFSYLSLPILQWFNKKISPSYLFILLLLFIIGCYVFLSPKAVFLLSWVYLFAFGYFFSKLNKAIQYLVLIALLLSAVVVFSYNPYAIFNTDNKQYWILHDLVGILWILGGYTVLKFFNINFLPGFLLFFDKYSFYIYLVHFVFLVGPFAVLGITNSICLNVCFALFCIALATFVLVKIVNLLNNIIVKVKKYYELKDFSYYSS